MMANDGMQADSVQSVLFVAPGQQQDDALKLWEKIFPGDSPDGFQRVTSAPTLNSSASGERDGFAVTLNVQVGRIDLILTQPPSSAGLVAGPPRINDVSSAAARAAELAKALAASVRPIRVALVLDLARNTIRGQEGPALLEMLPDFPFPRNATDVVVQFNARKGLECAPGTDMNRLCTWSTGQVGFATFGQGQGNQLLMMSPYIGLKIDVNTAPETRVRQENVGQILEELCGEAIAVYSDGKSRLS